MHVKKLIKELQAIENQFQEIKIMSLDFKLVDIDFIQKSSKGFIIIRTKDK
jgi:hypothetical protein